MLSLLVLVCVMSRLGPVALGDDFLLGEEVDDCLSLGLYVGEQGCFYAAERQVRCGRRYSDVDADHSGLDLELELTRVVAVLGIY